MKIGIPLEIMTGEARVALTPQACGELVKDGHAVYLQAGAGLLSGYEDKAYETAGVKVVADAGALYREARLIVKVKQPLAQDLELLRSDHLLFSYLHLAADCGLIEELCAIGLTAIPFESVKAEDGSLPLLAPMSRVAGRIATLRGASLLFRNRGGRGVLLGGVEGSDAGRVVILGAGVAGSHALSAAVALGAQVDVLDLNEDRLQQLKQQYPSITPRVSTPAEVARLCPEADLVVGAVLLAGRRAPVVLKRETVRQMPAGSVIVDIAIDQGGCVEGIRMTSSEELCYREDGVIHSAVPNMPAAVPRTATQSLSSAILPWVRALASHSGGLGSSAAPEALALQRARAIAAGEVVDPVLLAEFSTCS